MADTQTKTWHDNLHAAAHTMRDLAQRLDRATIRPAYGIAYALALEWLDLSLEHTKTRDSDTCEWCDGITWPCPPMDRALEVANSGVFELLTQQLPEERTET